MDGCTLSFAFVWRVFRKDGGSFANASLRLLLLGGSFVKTEGLSRMQRQRVLQMLVFQFALRLFFASRLFAVLCFACLLCFAFVCFAFAWRVFTIMKYFYSYYSAREQCRN